MKWEEVSKVNLPAKATIIRMLPYHSSALVVYQVPGKNYQQQWVVARWDFQAPLLAKWGTTSSFVWAFECQRHPQFFAIEGELLIMQDSTDPLTKSWSPALSAVNVETGLLTWRQEAPIHCTTVERGRIYTIEKQRKGPYRLVTRGAETGKVLRRELAYEAYDKISVSHDRLFGSAAQQFSVTTLDGEPVFEAEGSFPLRAVAADGSLYSTHINEQQQNVIYRWEPGSGDLWSLPIKSQTVSHLLPLPAAGQLLYSLQSKAQHLRFVCYDWSTDQERWITELNFGHYRYSVLLSQNSEGFLLSAPNQKNILLDAFTGAERIVPLSHKGPMFASKDALLLVKGQQLLAFSWKS
jgi:hypothetical protein